MDTMWNHAQARTQPQLQPQRGYDSYSLSHGGMTRCSEAMPSSVLTGGFAR